MDSDGEYEEQCTTEVAAYCAYKHNFDPVKAVAHFHYKPKYYRIEKVRQKA